MSDKLNKCMTPQEHADWLKKATLEEICNHVVWEEVMLGTAHCGWTDRARLGLVEQVQSGVKFALNLKNRDTEVVKLQSDLKKAAEALEFYAYNSGYEIRGGKLARSVLKELRGEK